MLQLYDLDKVKIKGLKNYKDYSIESDLSNGDKSLSFLYPVKESTEIVEECYIRTQKEEFVIKEIQDKGEWKSIKATLNVEDIEGHIFEHFDTTEKTIKECITLALVGTGWTIGACNVTRRRTVRKTNSSSWEILQDAKKVYRAEFELDTLNKKINIFEKLGSDKGVYFIDSLNLKTLDIQSNSYDFYTRIIAIGKNDLRVTLENFQYSKKVKTFLWKDEKYTDINSLREDALAKLNELSKPRKAYSASVIDLANMNLKYKNILSYSLGDTISLISKDKEIKEKQRIVKIVEYPQEPEKNTCEIANTTLRFEDLQKEFQETSNTVDNITTDNGTVDGNAINGISSKKIYDFETNVGKIVNLDAFNARIENLYVEKADVGSLNAAIINAGQLIATKATITDLEAINGSIVNLKSDKAEIKDLNVVNQKVNVIEGDTANFKTLLNGNLTSVNIQAGGITSDKLTIQNGFITNLMVANIDVSKINAGIINTNKFTIKSADGGIEIEGATQQFKDKNNKVRIQMGKDTLGNFNFTLRGEDGVTALIDHTGIKKDAIADDLIVKEMIGADAIGQKQIDYTSFTDGFNADSNINTIKATHIKLDNQNQTLDMAFNALKTEVKDIEIGGRNLILNSGAENGLTSWIKPETVGAVTVETINIYEGNKAFRILYTDTVGYQTLRQDVDVESNTSMTLNGYINVLQALDVTKTQIKLGVNCYNSIGQMIGGFQSTVLNKVTSIFTKVGVDFTTPLNTSKITIILLVIGGGAIFDNVKLEKGNKATDWTPAPEDIDSTINDVKEITTSNSTAIGVQQGKIDLAISNTQIIKDEKTILLKDDYSKTIITVNSTVETIGKHTTLLDANTKGIKEVTTNITEVKKNLEGITQSVSESETKITKVIADIGKVDGKIATSLADSKKYTSDQIITVNKSVSTANSEIVQLKESILLKAERINVDTAISNVENKIYTKDVIKFIDLINCAASGSTVSGGVVGAWGSGFSASNKLYDGDYIEYRVADSDLSRSMFGLSATNLNQGYQTIEFAIYKDISAGLAIYEKSVNKGYMPQKWKLGDLIGVGIDGGAVKFYLNGKVIYTSTTLPTLPLMLDASFHATGSIMADIKIGKVPTALSNSIVITEESIVQAKADIKIETDNIKLSVSNVDKKMVTVTSTADRALSNASTAQTQANLGVTNSKGALDKANNVDGRVTTLTTTVTETNTKVAGIETNLNGITSRVSAEEKKSTVIDNKVIAQETRIKTAEQKITDSQIISTVQATINTAKQQAIDSANNTTTGKLATYSTTSQMNSAITQNATSIKSEVANTYMTSGTANNIFATKSSFTQTVNDFKFDFSSSGCYNLIKNGSARIDTRFWANNGGARFAREEYEMGSSFAMALPNGIVHTDWIKLKPDTDYIYSCLFYSALAFTGASNTPLHWWIGTDQSNNAQVTVIDTNQNNISVGWNSIYVHFRTPNKQLFFKPFIYSNATSPSCSVNSIMLCEGKVPMKYSPHPNEIYSGSTIIDAWGVTVLNGALTIKNNAGADVLKGDSNGNLSFAGRLQPYDNSIRLFGDNCKIDGSGGAIRMQKDPYNYVSIDSSYTRFFNGNSKNGTNYVSLGVDWQGHTTLTSASTMLKLLGQGTPGVQARWAGDGGYCSMIASAFVVNSEKIAKDNIAEPTDINFTKILMETEIKKYNLKAEMDLIDKMPTIILPNGETPIKADLKLGLILDDLTEEAKTLIKPNNTEGADLYSMCSILWKVVQEHQLTIEELTKKVEQL